MRIGLVQFAPALNDLPTTTARLKRLIRAAPPADLLVLPELCNSGYAFHSRQECREASEEVSDSTFIEFLTSLCAQRGMYIVSGMNERAGEVLYNSAVLVGPQGLVGGYRKLHLFLNEKDYFHPGDLGLPVWDIGLCRVGMLVCFDWIFPEVWRILALKGADLIAHPSNLVLPGLAQRAVPIHALVNRVYTVTANRVGEERGLHFTGLSTIAAPDGEVLLQGPAEGEMVGVVEVEIERARDKKVTPRNDVLADRRPEVYGELLP